MECCTDCGQSTVADNSLFENNFFLDESVADQEVCRFRPMYRMEVDRKRWNFPVELQDRIRDEPDSAWNVVSPKTNVPPRNVKCQLLDPKRVVPYRIHDENIEVEAGTAFPCICKNLKNVNCTSAMCKFGYSKQNVQPESRFKDGLEIMDIPSTMMATMQRREKEKQRKKMKKEQRDHELAEAGRRDLIRRGIITERRPENPVNPVPNPFNAMPQTARPGGLLPPVNAPVLQFRGNGQSTVTFYRIPGVAPPTINGRPLFPVVRPENLGDRKIDDDGH